MKKLLFAALFTVLVSGCADVPQTAEAGVKEETYVMTGSRIPRKANGVAHAEARVVDKETLERQMQNQATVTGQGR
jgi:molybdopterin biosynthesis enzyme